MSVGQSSSVSEASRRSSIYRMRVDLRGKRMKDRSAFRICKKRVGNSVYPWVRWVQVLYIVDLPT